MSDLVDAPYSGVDNLETMEEAVNYNAFLQQLIRKHARRGDTIVDFGAGTGVIARPLAAAGHDVTCIEPDRALRVQLHASGLQAYASLSELPPESVDLVYSINVLEHIHDDIAALADIRGRVKPNGRLVIYVPAFPLLYSSMDRKVGHIRRYRWKMLEGALRSAGLAVDRIAYQDCLGFVAALLFKRLGSADGTINRSALLLYDRLAFPLSQLLDPCTEKCFGKNLLAIAHRA